MKHFTALALDLPENRVGQAHSDQPLTTALNKLLRSRIDNNDNFTKIVKLNVSTERVNTLIKKSDSKRKCVRLKLLPYPWPQRPQLRGLRLCEHCKSHRSLQSRPYLASGLDSNLGLNEQLSQFSDINWSQPLRSYMVSQKRLETLR